MERTQGDLSPALCRGHLCRGEAVAESSAVSIIGEAIRGCHQPIRLSVKIKHISTAARLLEMLGVSNSRVALFSVK
jgi:hypothetical protein